MDQHDLTPQLDHLIGDRAQLGEHNLIVEVRGHLETTVGRMWHASDGHLAGT